MLLFDKGVTRGSWKKELIIEVVCTDDYCVREGVVHHAEGTLR